jgi:hypothetical protein
MLALVQPHLFSAPANQERVGIRTKFQFCDPGARGPETFGRILNCQCCSDKDKKWQPCLKFFGKLGT